MSGDEERDQSQSVASDPSGSAPARSASPRSVRLRRTGPGRLVATNARGAQLPIGSGEDEFSPVELLLAAIAACTALDVDSPVARRAEPERFEVTATADKVRDQTGNHLENVRLAFRADFPAGAGGDAARELLPDLLARSHDRLCTVSRTVERPTPVGWRIEPAG